MEKEFNIQAFAEVIKKDFDNLGNAQSETEKLETSLHTALDAVKGQDALKSVADSIQENLDHVADQKTKVQEAVDAKNSFIKSIREGYAVFLTQEKKLHVTDSDTKPKEAPETPAVEAEPEEPKAEAEKSSVDNKPAETDDALSAFE